MHDLFAVAAWVQWLPADASVWRATAAAGRESEKASVSTKYDDLRAALRDMRERRKAELDAMGVSDG